MFKKKQPKCFQKLPQKVAKAVLPGIDVFHLSPKKLLFEDTLSPKTLKKSPNLVTLFVTLLYLLNEAKLVYNSLTQKHAFVCVENNVTRCMECSIFGHLQQYQLAQKHTKFSKVGTKVC